MAEPLIAQNPETGPTGLLKLLEQADGLSIAVLIVLSMMSLASWFVILTRLWDQRLIAKSYAEAQKKFWAAGNPWDGMATLSGRDNAFRMLVEDGIRAAQHHEGQLAEQISLNDWITVSLYRSIESVTNRLVAGLAILATTGSVSPFVGLLGTVWGIYNALQRIAFRADQHRADRRADRRGADHDRHRPVRRGTGGHRLQLAAAAEQAAAREDEALRRRPAHVPGRRQTHRH